MIIRIATQGQYKVSGQIVDKLDELDNKLVEVVAKGDESKFRDLLGQMLTIVKEGGSAVPDDELVSSDLILPSPDTTLDEARKLFVGDGLIANT
jgi:hypothetical protein